MSRIIQVKVSDLETLIAVPGELEGWDIYRVIPTHVIPCEFVAHTREVPQLADYVA